MERNWQAANAGDVKKQVEDPKFIHRSACGCLMPIHTFRIPGDTIEGRLRPCPNHDRADRARAVHIYTPAGDDHGEIGVAIRVNKMIWDAISDKENPLWGRWIKITYKGSVPTNYGHARKVYLIEYDKGTITENFVPVETTHTKQRKPRPARKIRRPAGSGVK